MATRDDADVSVEKAVKDWSIHVLTGLVLVLVGLVAILIFRVNVVVSSTAEVVNTTSGLRISIEAADKDLAESEVRGCVNLAQNSRYFPTSCLAPETVAVYGRDLVNVLSRDGFQGENRRLICAAILDMGDDDIDCRE